MWERIGRFARVVHFDKRGTGVSDRSVPVPGLDQRVDDARAVMDAAGVERGVLYGLSEGGPMAMLFAVTYPDRVERLVLHATDARIVDLDGVSAEERERAPMGRRGGVQLVGHRALGPAAAASLRRRGPIPTTGRGSRATSVTAQHRQRSATCWRWPTGSTCARCSVRSPCRRCCCTSVATR